MIDHGFNVGKDKVVWVPYARDGIVSKTLEPFFDVLATDQDAKPGAHAVMDFFSVTEKAISSKIEMIVCIPEPDNRAGIVRHAIALMRKTNGGVLMLMPRSFKHSIGTTWDLFNDLPYVGELIPEHHTDRREWFYWDWRYQGETVRITLP